MPRKKKEEQLALVENTDLSKLKTELTVYINQEIKKGFVSEIDKSNKRLIKEKNKRILSRDIVIIILLLFSGYLIYILYDNNYFDRYLKKNNTSNESNIIETNKGKSEDKKEPTLKELTEKYGYLLDNLVISNNSNYLNDYYQGNLTDELKNYLSLSIADFSKISKEEDYNIIESNLVKDSYESIFDSKYVNKSFKYNDEEIRYIAKLDSYITDTILKKEDTLIKREIINIKETSKQLEITTVEGIIKDNKIINVVSKAEVGRGDNKKLSDYKDKLNQITYTFNKDNKLIKIAK